MPAAADATPVAMGRSLLMFAAVLTLLSVVAGGVLMALKIQGNSGLSVAVTMVSAIFVAQRFFASNGRIMQKRELQVAVLGSLAIAVIVSIALVILTFAVLSGGFDEALGLLSGMILELFSFAGIIAIAAIGTAIQGAVLWFSYGYLARRIAKKKIPDCCRHKCRSAQAATMNWNLPLESSRYFCCWLHSI